MRESCNCKKEITCNFVVNNPTLSRILVIGSQRKQRHRLQVFWNLNAVIETSKVGGVVILIQHSDSHCGFGVIRGESSILGINCVKQTRKISNT